MFLKKRLARTFKRTRSYFAMVRKTQCFPPIESAIAIRVTESISWDESDLVITSYSTWHWFDRFLVHQRTTEEIERRDLSSHPSLQPLSPICTPRSPSRWAYTVMYTVIQLHRAVIIYPGVSRSPFYCSELIKLRIIAETKLFSLSPTSQICAPSRLSRSQEAAGFSHVS